MPSSGATYAILGGFAVAIIIVAALATRGGGTSPGPDAGTDSTALTSDSAPAEDCWTALRTGIDPAGTNAAEPTASSATPGTAPQPADSEAQLRLIAEAEQRAREDDSCLAPGEAAFVVMGLPGVSGVFTSRDGNMALEGFTFDPRATDVTPIGRCYVEPDDQDVFKTKAVIQAAATDFDEDENEVGENYAAGDVRFVTVDIGRTGEGGPYAAVVGELGQVDRSTSGGGLTPDLGTFRVTHDYNPGQDGAVAATFDVWNESTWTGVATFVSTGAAHTYNSRNYRPWTDADPRTAPNYPFVITLFCK